MSGPAVCSISDPVRDELKAFRFRKTGPNSANADSKAGSEKLPKLGNVLIVVQRIFLLMFVCESAAKQSENCQLYVIFHCLLQGRRPQDRPRRPVRRHRRGPREPHRRRVAGAGKEGSRTAERRNGYTY